MILLTLLFTAFLSDQLKGRIPNELTIGGFVMGMAYTLVKHDPAHLLKRLLTAGAVFAMLYIFFLVRALGAGDIKLLMMTGMFVDPEDFIRIVVLSAYIAGIIAVLKIISSKGFLRSASDRLGYIRLCIATGESVNFKEKGSDKKLTVRLGSAIFAGYSVWLTGGYMGWF